MVMGDDEMTPMHAGHPRAMQAMATCDFTLGIPASDQDRMHHSARSYCAATGEALLD